MAKKKGTSNAPTTTSRSMTMAGAVAVVVVIAIFGVLGVMLSNRSSAEQAEQPAAETVLVADGGEDADVPGGDAAPTVPPADDHGDTDEPEAAPETESEPEPPGERTTYTEPPPMTIDPAKEYLATITTPRGDIVIRLLPTIAPQTVNSFVFLAREGFYDGLTWHRVIEGFMAQGGDPTGTGMGGPGYSLPAEFTDQMSFDRAGIVAMARSSDPNSAGSQFFITTGPAPHLDNQYTIFGEVIEGLDVALGIPLRDPNTAMEPGEEILSITITEQE